MSQSEHAAFSFNSHTPFTQVLNEQSRIQVPLVSFDEHTPSPQTALQSEQNCGCSCTLHFESKLQATQSVGQFATVSPISHNPFPQCNELHPTGQVPIC